MLKSFQQHRKRILWGLAIIIIPAFAFFGVQSRLKNGPDLLGTIGKHKITRADFEYYLQMAELDMRLMPQGEDRPEMSYEEVVKKAWDYLLFLWKADQDKIAVTDKEVVIAVKAFFGGRAELNKQMYDNFLLRTARMKPRMFEEYMRNFIKINKLFEKYVKVDIPEDEIKALYNRETQKAKIAYLYIPNEKYQNEIQVKPEDVDAYYQTNKTQFKEEPKVKFKYVVIADDNPRKDDVLKRLPRTKSLEELKKEFSLEIEETEFLGIKDPIKGLSYLPKIIQAAFMVNKNTVSEPIETPNGLVLVEKVGEKQSVIPPLEMIKDTVEARLKDSLLSVKTKEIAAAVLEEIKTKQLTDLQPLAAEKKIEYKETEYFRYYDYIEGVGLDENVSKIVFGMKKNEIYSQPIQTAKGTYLAQLKDLSEFNETDYKNARINYYAYLYQQRRFIEELKFRTKVEQESNFVYYPVQTQPE